MKAAPSQAIPFKKVSEEKLIEALRLQGVEIYNYEDLRSFLISPNLNKNIGERWICWMISLHLIPLNRYKWGMAMYDVQEHYCENVQFYFKKDPQNPLKAVSMQFEDAIKEDLDEGKICIMSIANDIGVPKSQMSDAIFRLQRIFAVIANESKGGFQYTLGFSAIAAMVYAINVRFVDAGKLGLDYAEAASYYMLRAIISILPFTRISSSKEKFLEHFSEVDNAVREEAPEQAKAIERNRTQSFIYAKAWEAVLFVTLHNGNETMVIWDQILGRMERLTDVVEAILIAHIIQAKLPQEPVNVTEYIENYSKWNLEQIVRDALRILEHQKSCKQEFVSFFCPKLKKFHGYQLHGVF